MLSPPSRFLLSVYQSGPEERSFTLTVITLTVYTAVFEYQNQAIFNMTVFDGEPRCHIDTCFWYLNKKTSFLEYQKQVNVNMTLF
jgi:hypothetical protein